MQKLKVLIVEDDRTSRVLASESLSNYKGCAIDKFLAATSSEGLALFANEAPDIVFLDIMLPDGNGLQMLPIMLKQNPEAFIVMMTSSADAKDVQTAQESGAMGYILKPFNIKRFIDSVDAYLAYQRMLEALPEEERQSGEGVEISKEEIQFIFDNMAPEGEKAETVSDVIAGWDVLFIDDYEPNRDNAELYLTRCGCTLTLAAQGSQAKQLLLEDSFQMIFIDTTLADLDGYKVTAALREKEKQTGRVPPSYVIGMLSSQDETEIPKWKMSGMDDFLIKPCTFRALDEKMKHFAKSYQEDIKQAYVK